MDVTCDCESWGCHMYVRHMDVMCKVHGCVHHMDVTCTAHGCHMQSARMCASHGCHMYVTQMSQVNCMDVTSKPVGCHMYVTQMLHAKSMEEATAEHSLSQQGVIWTLYPNPQ